MASSITTRAGTEYDTVAKPYPWAVLKGSQMNRTITLSVFPFDVLLEVFSHLHPIDLLNLARTCKSFRRYLMSRKKAKGIWRAARGNVELPDCPAHLSEPAYANLAFVPYCHNCLDPGSHRVIWELSGRYCVKCVGPSSVTIVWTEAYFRTLFAYKLKGRSMPDLQWDQYLPTVYIVPNIQERGYCASSGNAFLEGYMRLIDDPEALRAYLSDWEVRATRNKVQAEVYNVWYPAFLKQRLDDILAKIRNEPWACKALALLSAEDLAPLKDHPVVTHPRVLTDNEWNSGVRDAVAAAIKKYRSAKVERKRGTVIMNRLHSLREAYNTYQLRHSPGNLRTAETDMEPRFADIALMPEIRVLVESSFDADASVEEDRVDKAAFLAELERWPNLCPAFNACRQYELSEMMADAFGCPTWIGILDLAVAWFRCEVCKKYVHFPEVLAHPCQRPDYTYWEREEWAHDYYAYDVAKVGQYHAWANALTPIMREDLQKVRTLVAACGLDPGTATAAQMDALDARVTCISPVAMNQLSEERQVMTWRRAVLSFTGGTDGSQWVRVSERTKKIAKLLEKQELELRIGVDEESITLACSLCDEMWTDGQRRTLWPVVDHLMEIHDLEGEDGDLKDKYTHVYLDGKIVTPAVYIPGPLY